MSDCCPGSTVRGCVELERDRREVHSSSKPERHEGDRFVRLSIEDTWAKHEHATARQVSMTDN